MVSEKLVGDALPRNEPHRLIWSCACCFERHVLAGLLAHTARKSEVLGSSHVMYIGFQLKEKKENLGDEGYCMWFNNKLHVLNWSQSYIIF